MQIIKKEGSDYYYVHCVINGERIKRCTYCEDKKSAEMAGKNIVKELLEDAANPDKRKQDRATLGMILDDYRIHLTGQVQAGEKSKSTLAFYNIKAKALIGEIGRDQIIKDLTAKDLDDYIESRGKVVSPHTVKKEIITLTNALKLARRNRVYANDPMAILPIRLTVGYKPRSRYLLPDELLALLQSINRERACMIAFIVATSARYGELTRAMVDDIDDGFVFVRGTKTKASKRNVPIVADWQIALMNFVIDNCEGREGKLFKPYSNSNFNRDIKKALDKVGFNTASCNDLRRTHSSWMVQQGVDLNTVSKLLGHTTTQLVQLTYGQTSKESLAFQLEQGFNGQKFSSSNDSTDGSHTGNTPFPRDPGGTEPRLRMRSFRKREKNKPLDFTNLIRWLQASSEKSIAV